MQATIYVTQEAMATAIAIQDLDYYARVSLSDEDETDLSKAPGYYLKNADKLNLAVLPATAHIALVLSPTALLPPGCTVSMPTNLRGCIFEHAPHLPNRYAEIVAFWSGEPINLNDSRAVYFQSPSNAYLVELRHSDCMAAEVGGAGETVACDKLLSEGIVVSITGLAASTEALHPDDFVEIVLPIDPSMLGIEPDDFQSTKSYRLDGGQHVERIFVTVADIRRSPDPDHLAIEALRWELLDYGYWY